MLGFTTTPIALQPSTPIPISSEFNPHPIHPVILTHKFPSSTLKFQSRTNPTKPRKFVTFAENGNGQSKDPEEEEEKREKKEDEGFKNKEEEGKRNERPTFNLRWGDLIVDRDPDNILAVGLTGLLAWASVQVLWQLFFISLAIIVAALKYSFIAALLIFILITLL